MPTEKNCKLPCRAQGFNLLVSYGAGIFWWGSEPPETPGRSVPVTRMFTRELGGAGVNLYAGVNDSVLRNCGQLLQCVIPTLCALSELASPSID